MASMEHDGKLGMGGEVCGNCTSFRPDPGQKFYNCTAARHAGLGYGMQVRADTRVCDQFSSFAAAPPERAEPRQVEKQPVEQQDPAEQGLCTVGQRSLVMAVGVMIIIVTWLLYTCATV
jgi:hypothetical protein